MALPECGISAIFSLDDHVGMHSFLCMAERYGGRHDTKLTIRTDAIDDHPAAISEECEGVTLIVHFDSRVDADRFALLCSPLGPVKSSV